MERSRSRSRTSAGYQAYNPNGRPSTYSTILDSQPPEGIVASQVRLLSSMDDQSYRPPSTPHRSYHPSQSQYDLPPPDSPSPVPSLSPTRVPYVPFPPSRVDHRSYSPANQDENIDFPGTSGSGDWEPAPPSLQYDSSEMQGSDRPGTSSSLGTRTTRSSRRPLPNPPRYGVKTPKRSYTNSDAADETTIPISTLNDGSDDESIFSNSKRSTATLTLTRTFSTEPAESLKSKKIDEEEEVEGRGDYIGPAPKAPQPRRGLNHKAVMTKKQVKLTRGELILDCKIPTILYSFLPRRDDNEFTHMRYTAVTCDPDDFVKRGFTLRQNIGTNPRETELFICVTMYNEDEQHFTRTMHGIMRNITHFCSRTKSRVWGKNGWEKIVVCIVSDGRKKVHPRVLDTLAAMGVYQHGIAKNMVNGREVKAHVYEYTTQVSMDSDLKFKGAEKGIVPTQIIFCLKEKNAKKLNSHRWFFNAFGASLNPNVCILLDVGTKPGPTSLYHLWKAFDTDSNVGGACGEIKAMKGRGWLNLLNPLVASQNFEYKMSNILDKPLESVFGYITVLPGALSAYRYHALQNDPETGIGPLEQYFKGEKLHGKDADIFTANMYLAEDRILCWELVAKKDERWVLKYVRSATGETDVPDAVPEFVSQRRRWLNGALFAALYSLIHFRQIWKTDHTVIRKVLLHIEFFYQFISLLFTYFSLANFYLTFYFIAGALSDKRLDPLGHGIGARIFAMFRILCILLICTQFILSMGNRPQGAKKMFMASMIAYAVIMGYTTFCSFYIVVTALSGTNEVLRTPMKIGDNVFTNLIVSTASTMGIYLIMSFLYFDPWHMFTSSFQYFMMLPSYIVTLQVYAFCNTHDVSWGTKGDNTVSTDLGVAVLGKKGDIVELEMPSEQLDIDSGYDEALRNLRDRLEVPKEPPNEAQEHEDYYRAVRTYMVLIWMVANGTFAIGITEAYSISQVNANWYLKFLLWAVAAVAFFRMIGSTAYLVMNMLHSIVEGKWKVRFTFMDRFEPPWKRVGKVNAKGAKTMG